MSISIHPLAESDLERAAGVLSLAFQRHADWVREMNLYRTIQPDGYLVAKDEGALVGMVGATIYPEYAYVGLMAVHPANQRQGVGALLMQSLLAWLEKKQVPYVLLDASFAGQPLYERLGFTPYEKVVTFQRDGETPVCELPQRVRPLTIPDLDRIAAFDQQAFGADRSRVLRLLLETYPGRAFVLDGEAGKVGGYLIAQRNRIGPWVMQDEGGAEELLRAALSVQYTSTVSVIVPGENPQAVTVLQRYGFVPGRVNRHMGKGTTGPIGERTLIFGQASMSLG